ncbi:hypothetical protein V8F06_013364, partial [Rhypophila decipiens]
ALDNVLEAPNRSVLKSQDCARLTRQYSSACPGAAQLLDGIVEAAEDWTDLDELYVEAVKNLRIVLKTVLGRVDGQEDFTFPAGLAQHTSQTVFLDKIEAAGDHARALDDFIDDTDGLGAWEKSVLQIAVSNSLAVRTWVLEYTSSMFMNMSKHTESN